MNVQEQEYDSMGTLFNKYDMPKEREPIESHIRQVKKNIHHRGRVRLPK